MEKRTTFTIYLLPTDDEIQNYKCLSCSQTAFQYTGSIKKTLPGDYRGTQLTPTIALCGCTVRTSYGSRYRCKYFYSVGFALEDTMLLLKPVS